MTEKLNNKSFLFNLGNFILIADLFYLPTLLFVFVIDFISADEISKYMIYFFAFVIDLILYFITLLIIKHTKNKTFFFVFLTIFWLLIELLIFTLAVDIHFIEEPNLRPEVIEFLDNREDLPNDKSQVYLYLKGILVVQILKILLMGREIIHYFKKKK